MSTLAENIAKKRLKKGGDLNDLIVSTVEILVKEHLKKQDLEPIIRDQVDSSLTKAMKEAFKGDPGDPGNDAEPVSVDEDGIITRVLAQIPAPKPGKKGDKGDSIKGDPGNDGSPDTPKEVVAKVNQNGGVEMKAVKGLVELFDEFRTAIQRKGGGKGGGGGMGQLIPYTITCDGVTTSFTLPYKVGLKGRAIWAYYEGSYLVPNTGFTISGKTLSTLFTGEDGTHIDVLFVRT